VVNDDDVTIVGATYATGVAGASWARGDFDYNGFVNDDDVTLLGALYNPSAPPLATPSSGAAVAAVPEPASLMLALVAVVGISCLIRRRHACCRRSTWGGLPARRDDSHGNANCVRTAPDNYPFSLRVSGKRRFQLFKTRALSTLEVRVANQVRAARTAG
jgi:hypothetical protein